MTNFKEKFIITKSYNKTICIFNSVNKSTAFGVITNPDILHNILYQKTIVNKELKKITANKKPFQMAKKKLILKGLGYKAEVENRNLSLKVNFSHPTNINLPNFISKIKTTKKSRKFFVNLEASDKILLGNFTQKIFKIKPVDSYKGKGFRIRGKKVKLKEIKKK